MIKGLILRLFRTLKLNTAYYYVPISFKFGVVIVVRQHHKNLLLGLAFNIAEVLMLAGLPSHYVLLSFEQTNLEMHFKPNLVDLLMCLQDT